MPSTVHLHNLVHALSPAEQAYIKQTAERKRSGSRHGRLFDLLLSRPDLLKQTEKGEKPLRSLCMTDAPELVRNLPEIKHYLYQFILRCLRHYQEGQRVVWRVEDLRRDAVILREKGLYEQAVKRLKKAQSLCREYDLHDQLIPVQRELASIFTERKKKGLMKEIELLFYGATQAIQQIENDLILEQGYYLMFALYRIHGAARTEELQQRLEDIRRNAQLTYTDLQKTFFQKYMHSNLENLYCRLLGDFHCSVMHQKEIVDIWREHPKFQAEHPRAYFIFWNNYLSGLLRVERYVELDEALEKYAQLETQNFDEEAELQNNLVFLRVLYYLNAKKFADLPQLEKEVLQSLRKYGRKVNDATRQLLRHNLSLFFWAREELGGECSHAEDQLEWNLGRAVYWNGLIVNDYRYEPRSDMRRLARILQIILQYELGAFETALARERSTVRHFQRYNCYGPYERLVLGHIRRILRQPSMREARVDFSNLQEELKELRKKTHRPPMPGYQEILIWIKSKLENKPFRDCF